TVDPHGTDPQLRRACRLRCRYRATARADRRRGQGPRHRPDPVKLTEMLVPSARQRDATIAGICYARPHRLIRRACARRTRQQMKTRDSPRGTTHEKALSHSRGRRGGIVQPGAAAYPGKPITLVNAFGPGSGSDTVCRVIAQPLSVALKETVIVEDRPGASGALAALYVARSAPDGYTLLMATNSPLSAVPFLMKNVSYDPVKDFTPVTRVGSFTLMLVVNPSVPATTVKELIEYGKANPGKLSFASANTSGIVAGETLRHWAELDMLHVPYKSSPPAIQ